MRLYQALGGGWTAAQDTTGVFRPFECRARQQTRGVERGQRGILVVQDERKLGAPEDHGIAALLAKTVHHGLKARDALGPEDPVDEFVHDDATDLFTWRVLRAYPPQSASGERWRVDLAANQPGGAEQADPADSATPARSNAIWAVSVFNPGMMKSVVFARRGAVSARMTASGIWARNAASNRSRSCRTLSISPTPSRATRAAAPNPAIAATFSVPAR